MKPVVVRNVAIGQGRPKICVPIVAAGEEGILSAAENMGEIPVDIVEWRADWYDEVSDSSKGSSGKNWGRSPFFSPSARPGREGKRLCPWRNMRL